ncbi:hypothetical protein JW916_08690 [Candidatus Sumerlaeota bacterium]|nr:hypothetical protein [Candidatus Sumerlaeota bacterium]
MEDWSVFANPAAFLYPLVFFLGTAVASAVLTGLAVFVARRFRLYAHPVDRSSHSVPTPQVGGVGICLALGAALAFGCSGLATGEFSGFFGFQFRFPHYALMLDPHWALLSYVVLGMLLGLIDDVLHLRALVKLAGLVFLATVPFLAEIWFDAARAAQLGFEHHPVRFWIQCLVVFGWIVFFANAFNFMDGVNGQSGVFALNAVFWWGAILFLNGNQAVLVPGPERDLLAVYCALGGAVLGFLFWNFPRPATFMGDSGALPLGAALAFLAIVPTGFGEHEVVVYVMPLSVFIYDVLYTLVRRAGRRENLLQAHRSHLYQRLLIATGWSHARLLAFHLPFYLLTGFAAWFYTALTVQTPGGESIAEAAGVPDRVVWWAWVAFVALVLVVYTMLVLQYEAKARKERSS